MTKSLLILPVLALATSAHAAVLWTTTFTGTNNTNDASRTLVNTSSGGFSGSLTATSVLTRSSATGNYFLNGTGNTFNNYNPNQNVDNPAGAGWNSIFDYAGTGQVSDLSQIVVHAYRYNSGGATQTADGQVRDVSVTLEFSLDAGATWTSAGTQIVNLTLSNTSTGVDLPLQFNLAAPVAVNFAADDFQIRYSVVNSGGNAGAFTGISSIELTNNVVPEPSAALLGAFGALALLRRRR